MRCNNYICAMSYNAMYIEFTPRSWARWSAGVLSSCGAPAVVSLLAQECPFFCQFSERDYLTLRSPYMVFLLCFRFIFSAILFNVVIHHCMIEITINRYSLLLLWPLLNIPTITYILTQSPIFAHRVLYITPIFVSTYVLPTDSPNERGGKP